MTKNFKALSEFSTHFHANWNMLMTSEVDTLSTQQPETRTVQDLFIPGILIINIWWKIRCIRNTAREHQNIMYNTVGSTGWCWELVIFSDKWKSLLTMCWWDRLYISDPWAPKMFLIRCYNDSISHNMLISIPGMKRFWKVPVLGSCVAASHVAYKRWANSILLQD